MSIYKGTTLIAGAATNTVSNAHTLLDWKWTDHIISSMEWLRADTFSWQSGAVYVAAYNHLVSDLEGVTEQSETIGSYTIYYKLASDGHKICGADQETTAANIYNESGVAWYYILDTANQRFKLPRINPAREELIQTVRAKGNGTALGLTDGTNFYGLISTQYSSTAMYNGRASDAYGIAIGTTGFSTGTTITSGIALGITSDGTKSGIVSDMSESTSIYKGKKYLYFYVGQYDQSSTEQTAGLNTSLFNGKVDLDGNNAGFVHIIETYHNGSDYYRIYSDGWCEQGGYMAKEAASTDVTYFKEFTDTNYNIQMSVRHTALSTDGRPPLINSPTTTGFVANIYTNYEGFYWKACGYIVMS